MRVCFDQNDRLLIASPAKLNLFLELHSRSPDGFHELETIMVKFGLYDFLWFEPNQTGTFDLEVRSSSRLGHPDIPTDSNNLIIKTLQLMRDLAGHSFGAGIKLFKNIPVQAGMGGASGNAAAAIVAANRLWKLGWPRERLLEIASRIGSDVAFFLGDSLGRCIGKGEKVQNLPSRCRFNIVVAQPSAGISTAETYSRCEVPNTPVGSNRIADGLSAENPAAVGQSLFNRLEQFAELVNSDVSRMRDAFTRTNCLGHQLTGSGSCYFGIYSHHKTMKIAGKILANRLPEMNIITGQTLA